jgi:hypothetical protein
MLAAIARGEVPPPPTPGPIHTADMYLTPGGFQQTPPGVARNEAPGTEDNPPDRSGDIAALEAQLQQLRGAARPEGAATHE